MVKTKLQNRFEDIEYNLISIKRGRLALVSNLKVTCNIYVSLYFKKLLRCIIIWVQMRIFGIHITILNLVKI